MMFLRNATDYQPVDYQTSFVPGWLVGLFLIALTIMMVWAALGRRQDWQTWDEDGDDWEMEPEPDTSDCCRECGWPLGDEGACNFCISPVIRHRRENPGHSSGQVSSGRYYCIDCNWKG